MNPADPGLRRCGNCNAFDAWTGRQRREDCVAHMMAGDEMIPAMLIVIAHECGVCHEWWRVPIRPPIRFDDAVAGT